MEGVQHLAGFVLPKVTLHSLDAYGAVLPPGHSFELMPLLETVEVFNPVEMAAFRQRLGQEPFGQRVLSLRIGGNDLLQLLGLRRPRGRSIYTTPLAGVIDQLVATFRPHGWNLTGPVFERLDCPGLLAQETRQDLAHSLFGKSAIHPDQVPVIEAQYRADWRDLEAAQRILDADAPAVFQWDGSMCEPAVHRAWAEIICARARLYGIRGAPRRSGALLPSVGDTGLTPTSPRHKRNGQAPSGKGRR
jgi:citrate lyase beta subunit